MSLKGLLISKGKPKNQCHQMILALDLTALKFNGVITMDSLEIKSNDERVFNESKIDHNARSRMRRVSKRPH